MTATANKTEITQREFFQDVRAIHPPRRDIDQTRRFLQKYHDIPLIHVARKITIMGITLPPANHPYWDQFQTRSYRLKLLNGKREQVRYALHCSQHPDTPTAWHYCERGRFWRIAPEQGISIVRPYCDFIEAVWRTTPGGFAFEDEDTARAWARENLGEPNNVG